VEVSSESSNSWETQAGKRVVLVEPDIPWYITKKKTMPEGVIQQTVGELNQVEYRDNADFKSEFKMKFYRPDMGYGYSYAQRQVNPEPFTTNQKIKSIDFNVIACSLLLVRLLLVVIRYYRKS